MEYNDNEIQDNKYREELLSLFSLKIYEHKTIMDIMLTLFNKYKNNKLIKNILDNVIEYENKFPVKITQETAFMMLFSFHNLFLFHTILKQLNKQNSIEKNIYKKMIIHIQKNNS
tara:strand:- start:230 stop:574 length:345 start_codon:yes stop_codon:yes gene_type:complete